MELLKIQVDEYINYHNNFYFVQDKAPPHRPKFIENFLNSKNINVLKWPGNSPDLNPMENLWAEIVKRVYSEGKIYF